MAQVKEPALRFITLIEFEDRASLFLFTDDVTEVGALSRDVERLEHREDYTDAVANKDGNATYSILTWGKP